jgi:hypothetical protein
MNEQQWLETTEPRAMLAFLWTSGKLSKRKARLWAAASCRSIWHLLTDERSRKAVEVAERYADGEASHKELKETRWPAWDFALKLSVLDRIEPAIWAAARCAWLPVADSQIGSQLMDIMTEVTRAVGTNQDEIYCALFRDLFGNPFRPLPPLLTVAGGLARAAYEERILPEGRLDNHRLAVLADALEEAGFEDATMLSHLRQTDAVHVRGCAVVDYLLGKE